MATGSSITRRWGAGLAAACALGLALSGCQSSPSTPYEAIRDAEFGKARTQVHDQMTGNRRDRRYMLDRIRAGVLTMADGHAESAEYIFEDTYDFLRTQGINRDRTVAAVVVHEGVRIWKGEPFEQALAMAYYGMAQASMGSWDNTRAAMDNALFYLRDFGEDDDGERLDTYQIARRSLEYERAIAEGKSEEEAEAAADYLDHGYVLRSSNFTLGYLLNGIANQQLGRAEEASDNFTRVQELAPELDPLVEAFRDGRYNTVLVVSWGLGPRKEGYGPDNTLARFRPRQPSNDARLRVNVGDAGGRSYEQVLDVNTMAADHMWNNLEQVRQAKSLIGQGLMVGGLVATDIGLQSDDWRVAVAGLGTMLTGALVRGSAAADTRHADVLPQRAYVVPLHLEDEQPIELQIEGRADARLVLRGLEGPESGEPAQFRYVRLPMGDSPGSEPPQWAVAGELYWGNPHTGRAGEPHLPYILGGRSADPPQQRAMRGYREAGYLEQMTLDELQTLHMREQVHWRLADQGGYAGLHVLEGGRSLVPPLAGTTGFMRLFGQRHEPYEPRTSELREARQRLEERMQEQDLERALIAERDAEREREKQARAEAEGEREDDDS